jgi:hypothetical protein
MRRIGNAFVIVARDHAEKERDDLPTLQFR